MSIFKRRGRYVDDERVNPLAETASRREESPELVLVDPDLARYARAWLPDPGDTLRRVERLVHAHRLAVSRATRAEALGVDLKPVQRPPVEPTPPTATRSRRRLRLSAAAATSGALTLALLVGIRIEFGGNPASADTAAVGKPPVSVPRGVTQNQRPAPRRFVWAPVADASAYHVEFFRGSTLVLAVDPSAPEVVVPTSWPFRGKHETLLPGEYRWYVWPVSAGRRAPAPNVRAQFKVGD